MYFVDHTNIKAPEYMFRLGSEYRDARQVLHDASQAAGVKTRLRIRGPATFSGKETNYRIYPGPKVKRGTDTWIKDYPKPVLREHRSGRMGDAEDPLGRVSDAKYIQLVSDDAWYNDFQNPLPEGTGFIELIADIGDGDAIEKILDRRYLTMSVGFDTDALVCSICGKDWRSKPCEHIPGRMHMIGDAKNNKQVKMRFITGEISYEEVSFVNRPANSLAVISSHEFLKDSMVGTDPVELPTSSLFCDAIFIGDTQYQGVLPTDKEVISILTVDTATTQVSAVDSPVIDKRNPVILQSVSPLVVNVADVKSDKEMPCQKGNSLTSEEPSMADTKDTSVVDKTAEAPKASEVPTIDVAKIQKELEDVRKVLVDKDSEIKALRDDNTKLALEAQQNLAKRLLDLRISLDDPTVASAKKDQAKYVEVSADYAKRSRLSLQDAIRDEESRLLIKASHTPKPEVKNIARGSVTQESVGVQVDTKNDEPKVSTEDSKEVKVGVDPAGYKTGLRSRFKNPK